MKTSRSLHVLLAVVFCSFATAVTFAKGSGSTGKGSSGGKVPKVKPTPEPTKGTSHSVIESVSGNGISLKNAHDSKNYRIDARTAVTLDGSRVAAGALKAGMYAEVTASSIDPGLAVAIAATNPKSH